MEVKKPSTTCLKSSKEDLGLVIREKTCGKSCRWQKCAARHGWLYQGFKANRLYVIHTSQTPHTEMAQQSRAAISAAPLPQPNINYSGTLQINELWLFSFFSFFLLETWVWLLEGVCALEGSRWGLLVASQCPWPQEPSLPSAVTPLGAEQGPAGM